VPQTLELFIYMYNNAVRDFSNLKFLSHQNAWEYVEINRPLLYLFLVKAIFKIFYFFNECYFYLVYINIYLNITTFLFKLVINLLIIINCQFFKKLIFFIRNLFFNIATTLLINSIDILYTRLINICIPTFI